MVIILPEIDYQGASPASNTGMGGTLRIIYIFSLREGLKKRVKLGLLAEAGEGEGSEEGPRVQGPNTVIRFFLQEP